MWIFLAKSVNFLYLWIVNNIKTLEEWSLFALWVCTTAVQWACLLAGGLDALFGNLHALIECLLILMGGAEKDVRKKLSPYRKTHLHLVMKNKHNGNTLEKSENDHIAIEKGTEVTNPIFIGQSACTVLENGCAAQLFLLTWGGLRLTLAPATHSPFHCEPSGYVSKPLPCGLCCTYSPLNIFPSA